MKWKRGRDWPNNGDEFMTSEWAGVTYTIKRMGPADNPWYELRADGEHLNAGWVMRKLKTWLVTVHLAAQEREA